MNKSFIGAAALALGIMASFPAQAYADQPSVPVTGAHQAYTPTAAELSEFGDTYALANGQVAQFTQRGKQLYVQLKSSYRPLRREDGSGRHFVSTRLRPVAPGTFVTDKGAELAFRNGGEEVHIDGFERLPEARVAVNETNVKMVARR